MTCDGHYGGVNENPVEMLRQGREEILEKPSQEVQRSAGADRRA